MTEDYGGKDCIGVLVEIGILDVVIVTSDEDGYGEIRYSNTETVGSGSAVGKARIGHDASSVYHR